MTLKIWMRSLPFMPEEEAVSGLLWLMSTIWVGFTKTLQGNSPTGCFITQFQCMCLIFTLSKTCVDNSS